MFWRQGSCTVSTKSPINTREDFSTPNTSGLRTMVSLRRSARLLALEDKKPEGAPPAQPPAMVAEEVAQAPSNGISSERKRGRKEKGKEVYKEEQAPQASTPGNPSNPSAWQDPTERVIAYLLDWLEVKDTNELFSMPDDLQTYDYAESLGKPGDLATLRQKHRDQMYPSIELFEADVHTVFSKAIESNSPDSIPHNEAVSIIEQAKQIFQSLKYNPTYTEMELSAWHHKYFHYRKKTARNYVHGETSNPPASIPQVSSSKGRGRPRGTTSRPRGVKAPIERGLPKSCNEERRHTYKPVSDPVDSLITVVGGKPAQLLYNKTTSYKESLLHFVKDAGPAARVVAEQRVQGLWRPHDPISNAASIEDASISRSDNLDIDPIGGYECRLQTNELLTLFSLIETHEFFKKSKNMASSSSQATNGDRGNEGVAAVNRDRRLE